MRVRDHCHITGKFRGSAHQECNLKPKITPEAIKIPVEFHNVRGYDSHLIMQQIGEIAKNHAYKNKKGEEQHLKINVIPNNMETYMAFMLGDHLTFINSLQTYIRRIRRQKVRPNVAKRSLFIRFHGLFRKIQSNKTTDKIKILYHSKRPAKTDEEYKHAKKVWKTFDIKTMGGYDDLYLKSDVLLLADVFENFRKACLLDYKLDPCHFFTSPGLSWNTMLKMNNIKLELMTNVNIVSIHRKRDERRVQLHCKSI